MNRREAIAAANMGIRKNGALWDIYYLDSGKTRVSGFKSEAHALEAAGSRVERDGFSEDRTSAARDLADIAADKIERLAADVEKSSGNESHKRSVAESRREAIGALHRLNVALGCQTPDGCHVGAAAQAGVIEHVAHLSPSLLRKNVTAWRKFADGGAVPGDKDERVDAAEKVPINGRSYIIKITGARIDGRSVDGEYDGGKTIEAARNEAADFANRGITPEKIRIGVASEDGDRFETIEYYNDFLKAGTSRKTEVDAKRAHEQIETVGDVSMSAAVNAGSAARAATEKADKGLGSDSTAANLHRAAAGMYRAVGSDTAKKMAKRHDETAAEHDFKAGKTEIDAHAQAILLDVVDAIDRDDFVHATHMLHNVHPIQHGFQALRDAIEARAKFHGPVAAMDPKEIVDVSRANRKISKALTALDALGYATERP